MRSPRRGGSSTRSAPPGRSAGGSGRSPAGWRSAAFACRRAPSRVGAGAAAHGATGGASRWGLPSTRSPRTRPPRTPASSSRFRDLYDRVALEVARLPLAYRDAIGLRYYDGLACKDIAATLVPTSGIVRYGTHGPLQFARLYGYGG